VLRGALVAGLPGALAPSFKYHRILPFRVLADGYIQSSTRP